jgi:hypothetical protein
MRTLVVGVAGVGATLALAGILAALGAAGSIPLAILATWAIVGVVGRRAAMSDSDAVEAWRSDRVRRREAFRRIRGEREGGRR